MKKTSRAPGQLAVALDVEPRTLDPRNYTDAAATKVGGLIFEGLVRNQGQEIVPALAERWETPSPTRYIFHLRRGLYFHNGRPLTSKDVKATFDYVMNPASKSPKMSAFADVKSISAPDDLTIIFDLKSPSAPFLSELVLGIVPAGAGSELTETPVGSGPFMFVSKSTGQIQLAANERYHEGAPNIKSLLFRVIPDETVRVLELEQGGVDLIMNPITPDLLPRFEKNKKLRVIKSQGTNYSYLGFNMADPLTGDLNVRRAIAHAIDRGSVIRHIMKGLATPADSMFTTPSPFHAPGLPSYEHDPAKAMAMLDKAGYKDPDGDGPQLRFTLHFSTSQNETRKRLAEVYQWQLAQVGVGMDIRSYEWGTFYGHILKGNFQVYSLTWVGISDPDIMHYVFHSSMAPPGGANRGRYENHEVDKLTEQGKATFGQERVEIYRRVQRILAEEVPYISLWHSVNVAVTLTRLKGFALEPDESLDSLKTARAE
ncbi:MAG: ABC transporter substrate-binding protein, partial [Nitrospinota bacterium]|nr:ABC transporter substrate-binding protein [Nitrospinota bacterium]